MTHTRKLESLMTRIERTRQHLNNLIDTDRDKISNAEVVNLSQTLDHLLVEYLKEQKANDI